MTIPEVQPEPIEKVREALTAYFAENEGFSRGIRFYTPHQWEVEKGEDVGKGAALSIVIEESLLHNILGGYLGIELNNKVETELNDLLYPMGYYAALGFSWSLHIFAGDP